MDNIKDIYGFVTDRIQKLTAALYRVTDLLSDKEPIKWTLRDKALNLTMIWCPLRTRKIKMVYWTPR